jgi:hypothetical protein
MFLNTSDAVAILAYAGLGATAQGTEPADWMSAVLRGRNLPLEHSLGVLAEAMKRELPPHLVRLPGTKGPSHSAIAMAYVGHEPRLYGIELALTDNRKQYLFRGNRYFAQVGPAKLMRTPRIAIAGSGAPSLIGDRTWQRELLRLVNTHDRGRAPPKAVADFLASVNHRAHLNTQDGSVGPSCIVAWRYRLNTRNTRNNSGHTFYSGLLPAGGTESLPNIDHGNDIHALVGTISPFMIEAIERLQSGESDGQLDEEAANALLNRLPQAPDETLR